MRIELDTRRAVKAITDTLDRHKVGVEVERDILAPLNGRNGGG